MNLGSHWIIFFMYSASPCFNSFFAAKTVDLPNKNKKHSLKIASASFPFTLSIHSRAVLCWHHLLNLSYEQPLRQCQLSSPVCAPQGQLWGALLVVLSAFLPKELEKQPGQGSGQPQGCRQVPALL